VKRSFLQESSLARIWQHLQSDRSFGIITSYRHESPEEDAVAWRELKSLVRESGYGYIELEGGYTHEGGEAIFVQEPSLFIPNVSKEELLEWGDMYGQESVIFKDRNSFGMYYTQEPRKGDLVIEFARGMEMSQEATKDFFSALKKGSHRGRKFVFSVAESRFLYDSV